MGDTTVIWIDKSLLKDRKEGIRPWALEKKMGCHHKLKTIFLEESFLIKKYTIDFFFQRENKYQNFYSLMYFKLHSQWELQLEKFMYVSWSYFIVNF
jgi:hypothetical protein